MVPCGSTVLTYVLELDKQKSAFDYAFGNVGTNVAA